jgi:hypothetical protein
MSDRDTTISEAHTDRRERWLEWIARELHYSGGAEVAEARRGGTCVERQAAIARLQALARAERARGLAGHWAYDLARHAELVCVISQECALLATEDLRTARRAYQAAGRQVRHHLHRRGRAPISLMLRLSKARGGLLAVVAGRKAGDAR